MADPEDQPLARDFRNAIRKIEELIPLVTEVNSRSAGFQELKDDVEDLIDRVYRGNGKPSQREQIDELYHRQGRIIETQARIENILGRMEAQASEAMGRLDEKISIVVTDTDGKLSKIQLSRSETLRAWIPTIGAIVSAAIAAYAVLASGK